MGSRALPKKLSQSEQNNRDTVTGIIFLAVVVIGVLTGFLYKAGVFDTLIRRGDIRVDMQTGKVVKEIRKFPDATPSESVEIPGYNLIEFKANTQQQNIKIVRNLLILL